jgi:hypothetical protein
MEPDRNVTHDASWAALAATLAACASAPRPRPVDPMSRGMRASDHLVAAREHDRLAQERASWPDSWPDATGRVDRPPIAMPWRGQWDSPEEHEHIAAAHRAAAAELQADYERACGERTADEVSRSPIALYGIGGVSTASGVVVFLAPAAGPANHLLADISCHRAWMMLAPAAMDDCPLDLPGIHVDAMGDDAGVTLTITAQDQTLVPEVQRRLAHDLEQTIKAKSAP